MRRFQLGNRVSVAQHLEKSVPDRWVRFFRVEALHRWHLEPDDVSNLNRDWQGLVAVLCDRLSLTIRRAEAEADDFYTEFNERMARAIDDKPDNSRLAECRKSTTAA